MTAFERHPMRKHYERMAERLGPYDSTMRWIQRSPQNRRVRAIADLEAANSKHFPNHVTRQQRRWAKRHGTVAA